MCGARSEQVFGWAGSGRRCGCRCAGSLGLCVSPSEKSLCSLSGGPSAAPPLGGRRAAGAACVAERGARGPGLRRGSPCFAKGVLGGAPGVCSRPEGIPGWCVNLFSILTRGHVSIAVRARKGERETLMSERTTDRLPPGQASTGDRTRTLWVCRLTLHPRSRPVCNISKAPAPPSAGRSGQPHRSGCPCRPVSRRSVRPLFLKGPRASSSRRLCRKDQTAQSSVTAGTSLSAPGRASPLACAWVLYRRVSVHTRGLFCVFHSERTLF